MSIIDHHQAMRLLHVEVEAPHWDLQQRDSMAITVDFESEGGLLTYYTHDRLPSQAIFQAPSGRYFYAFFVPDQHLVHGDVHHGRLQGPLHLPRWNVETGLYQLAAVMLVDEAGRQVMFEQYQFASRGWRTSFEVAGAMQDTTAPLLIDVSLEPLRIPMDDELAVPSYVTIFLSIDEAESGLAVSSSDFVQPSHVVLRSLNAPQPQTITAHFGPENQTEFVPNWLLRTGSSTFYELAVSFPYSSWPGMWEIASVRLLDEAGNLAEWSSRTLSQLGFGKPFYVTNFNLTFIGEWPFDYERKLFDETDDYYAYEDDYYYE